MLIDHVTIEIRSGKGGDGAISFLHDKNTEWGGPDGGNGGRGGSIYFIAKNNLSNLYNFRHSKTFIAMDGEKGGKTMRYGKSAPDLYVEVPVGTVIKEAESGAILADLKEENQVALLAKGGRGGRGNACFKSSRHRIPKVAENGHPGERKRLQLELRMVADCGIIGFPSVGKSTFINLVSHAKAETGDYPFTTISPNLGVAFLKDGRTFILADMPGLIEGAHAGKGLGIDFLRHIERCRILLHMVSMDGERDPYEAYLAINEELKLYDADLENRPQIVVASKMDEDGAEERKKEFDKKLGFESMPLSAYTYDGIETILLRAMDLIERSPVPTLKEERHMDFKVYDAHLDKEEKDYLILPVKAHVFEIKGEKALKAYSLINISTDEGIAKLIKYLDQIGVEEGLKKAGAQDGDIVVIGDFRFEYFE